ncbi:MAG: rhodanese-like domain-containing protein [Actinomycetia bacterium]|nr:rhodanese-like domain-containing protein [Actinomycetes bacterium]
MTRCRLILISLLTVIAIVAAACSSGSGTTDASDVDLTGETQEVPVDGGSYTDVSVKGLEAMLQNKDFLFVNVHIPYAGEIEQTDAFVPFDQVQANLSAIPSDKSAKIAVYCRSGGMSAIAARDLVALGYTNVWNLDGGMNAWVAAGNELLQKSG